MCQVGTSKPSPGGSAGAALPARPALHLLVRYSLYSEWVAQALVTNQLGISPEEAGVPAPPRFSMILQHANNSPASLSGTRHCVTLAWHQEVLFGQVLLLPWVESWPWLGEQCLPSRGVITTWGEIRDVRKGRM